MGSGDMINTMLNPDRITKVLQLNLFRHLDGYLEPEILSENQHVRQDLQIHPCI
jgi:hypothetical protein